MCFVNFFVMEVVKESFVLLILIQCRVYVLVKSNNYTQCIYTEIRFVWVSAKFGTSCTVVSVNGALVEDKMRRFNGECAHFIFNKCPIYTTFKLTTVQVPNFELSQAKRITVYTLVFCECEEFKYNPSRRTYCWGYAMKAVIHKYNSETLKDMPHKEHIAGGSAMQAVIHKYNSESLKDMPDKQQIVGDDVAIHVYICESLKGMPHKTANCGGDEYYCATLKNMPHNRQIVGVMQLFLSIIVRA